MNKVKWTQVYKMLGALNSVLLLQYKLVHIINLNLQCKGKNDSISTELGCSREGEELKRLVTV